MIILTMGDTGPLTGTALSRDVSVPGTVTDTPASLVGAALQLRIRRPDQTVLTLTPTVVSAAAGTWSCPLDPTSLNQPGAYAVELRVTYTGGAVQTFPSREIRVRRPI